MATKTNAKAAKKKAAKKNAKRKKVVKRNSGKPAKPLAPPSPAPATPDETLAQPATDQAQQP